MKTSNNTLRVVKQNLRLGEKVLKDFKQEYPYLKSNSMINVRMNRFDANIKDGTKRNGVVYFQKVNRQWQDLAPLLKGKSALTGFNIYNMRNNSVSAQNKLEYITNYMKIHRNANCRECSFVIYDKLKQIGHEPQNIKLDIIDIKTNKPIENHAFTVIGLDKNADITKPHTWGKNSVIVDAWCNIVQKTQDGIEYMKNLFRVDEKNRACTLTKYTHL